MTIEEYVLKDKDFNSSKFISDANRMIQSIYYSLASNELDSIRSFLSDKVYQIFQNELQQAKDEGTQLIYDDVVIDSEIQKIETIDGVDCIFVISNCQYLRYFLSSHHAVVRGSDSNVQTKNHVFVFCKINHARQIIERCEGCGYSYDFFDVKQCPQCGLENRSCRNLYRIENME